MNKNLMDIQKVLLSNEALIIFSGRFSQGIIEELGDALKKHLKSEDAPKSEIYNVFSVFIEQTQNIKNYSASKLNTCYGDKIVNSGIVAIGRSNDGYYVWSGNLVYKEDCKTLTERLDMVVPMDKDNLKKLYKKQLRKEISSDNKGGAGLGIIDMARKSSKPITYSVSTINQKLSFFELKVTV